MFTADISPVGPAPPVTLTWTHIDTGATWKHLDRAVFQEDIWTLGLLHHVETEGWQFTSSMWLKKGQRGSFPEPPFPWTSGVTQYKRSYSHIFLVQKASPIVWSFSVWSWLWSRADLPQYSHKADHKLWGSSGPQTHWRLVTVGLWLFPETVSRSPWRILGWSRNRRQGLFLPSNLPASEVGCW